MDQHGLDFDCQQKGHACFAPEEFEDDKKEEANERMECEKYGPFIPNQLCGRGSEMRSNKSRLCRNVDATLREREIGERGEWILDKEERLEGLLSERNWQEPSHPSQ